MILLFFILLGCHKLVTSELMMMLVYGVPNSLTGADLNKTLSWDQCIQSCFNLQPCVMAWQSNNNCYTYDYNSMGTVTQTDSKNGSIVAFKVDSVDGECPLGTNPPTFNNRNATGSLYVDYDTNYFPKWVYYSISLAGNKWSISYNLNNSCPSNFIDIIERSDGTAICINGLIDSSNSTTTGYSYEESATYCNEFTPSTHLTGIWYPEDAAYFSAFAKSVRSTLVKVAKTNDTYIRIDGIRTTACQSTPSSEECMSVKGFNFTGPPPDNFDEYNWITDSSAQKTLDDNCIVMVLNGTNPVQMDVRTCFSTGSPLLTKIIFCSCPAWEFS